MVLAEGMVRFRRQLPRAVLLGGLFIIVASATFAILYWRGQLTTPGPATLNLGHRGSGHAVLQIPSGWSVRPNGIDKWGQCAVLVDQNAQPRLQVCAFGYLPGSEQHPGLPDDAAALARRLAGNHRTGDEVVALGTYPTAAGEIHEIARTYHTRASHYVVSSGTVAENEYIRNIGPCLLLLRIYADAAQAATLNPIMRELAAQAKTD